MAEIVEYRVGKTLDEIDVLIKFGLFDDEQAREVIKRREEFEYALRRRTSDKLRYLKYIKFEMNLLDSIEKYQKAINKKSEEDEIFKLQAKKLTDIIKSRSGHINFLYRKLIIKHQFDKRLWKAYIEFAKQRKMFPRVSALYWRVLRVMSNDESLWLDAANFEINLTKDLNTARKLLLLGLRHITNSQPLKELVKSICDVSSSVDLEGNVPEASLEGSGSTTSAKTIRSRQPVHKSRMDMLYERYDDKGIREARKLYHELEASVKHQTFSLYIGMIQLELLTLKSDDSASQINRIREVFERALSKYGRLKAKLWYEYLQFEHQHAKTLEDFERINRIYTRAQATLEKNKVDRVIERYTLMQVKEPSKIDVEFSDYSDLEDTC